MSRTHAFDRVVLGSGAVGQTAAYNGRERGCSVLLVEAGDFGGTCPNRGCDAKKPYVHAAAVVHAVQRLQAAGGGVVGELSMDWSRTAAFKKSFTRVTDPRTRQDLAAAGVELHAGTAAFTGPDTLRLSDGREVRAGAVVVATGQHPRPLEIPGGALAIDSDAFLELDDLPPRVAMIGSGYIGMEFACAAALAGREVVVIGSREHPLTGFDADAVAVLEAALPTLGPHGVRLVAGARATRLEPRGDGVAVFTDADAPAAVADLVVNATGRVASVDGLGLEAAGVEAGAAGVKVDATLRSPGNPRVWAGGDVADTGRPALIPTAVADARVLVKNLAAAANGGALLEVEDQPIATVAFTTPTLASVGLTEADARRAHGGALHVASGDLTTKKFYRQLGVEHAFYKLIFDADRRLIGAHLAGPESEEVVNVFAVAIHEGCSQSRLCDAVLTYPTVSAAMQAAYRKTARG
ncbi:dihydrolipoyl dehydrogenase family protein [Phycisphaera mikurensis]|uniref:Putative glutathione reductase n=1 Tax=Phycisphaera mikurensis (strain NBRC 102666 / KCTC 22515 / FYK2301M01) TaxID=1142394 RepID=I0IBW6_PHYMF|nr:NAD(P)/FAD-dependent oxidoreductase [Phycisphaera mikurensis]MBB6442020.1 glutathione reductase (NADPH) [Phycisphaera mikurensis]BAM02754.1 putative glutathione reductase [Phycisphaera mikurensis NBRC 102666]